MASASTPRPSLVTKLDPTFTTAYISRNFGYMVYDMPFGLDEKGQPKPQMVDKYTKSKDGKLWTFTLRPQLKFSDGSPVRAADVVASMQRPIASTAMAADRRSSAISESDLIHRSWCISGLAIKFRFEWLQ